MYMNKLTWISNDFHHQYTHTIKYIQTIQLYTNNFLGLLKFYAKHLNLIKERSIRKIYANFGNNNLDTHDKR